MDDSPQTDCEARTDREGISVRSRTGSALRPAEPEPFPYVPTMELTYSPSRRPRIRPGGSAPSRLDKESEAL
ncbi:unnamed protein product [Penicillium bialowiezense]